MADNLWILLSLHINIQVANIICVEGVVHAVGHHMTISSHFWIFVLLWSEDDKTRLDSHKCTQKSSTLRFYFIFLFSLI